MISALTVDTGSGTCSALNDNRCSIYARRPLACRTAPLHYTRAEASAAACLKEFVRTPGYRCNTGEDAPVVIDGNRIVDMEVRQARADALEVASRDKSWHNAIAGRMRQPRWNDAGLPTLAEVGSSAPFAATTTSMRIAWQIAAEAGLMGVEEVAQLIAAQAAAIDRELAADRYAGGIPQALNGVARCAMGGKRTLAAHAHWPLSPDARLRPAPFADSFKPSVEPAQIMGKRLPHVTELINVAVEADVSDGEPLP